jgi:hypothetical protein
MTMKSRIFLSLAGGVLLLAVWMQTASAQQALNFGPTGPTPRTDPNDPFGQRALTQSQITLAPAPPRPGDPLGAVPMIVDPTTGLATPAPQPVWIDPAWHPANIWMTNVDFNGLPLSEIAEIMRKNFGGSFDVLPLPQINGWDNQQMWLKLSKANAADLINAMNLVFENNKDPVRWQLKMTDDHPFLILKYFPESDPNNTADAPRIRRIFYVGDILGDEKSGGMTIDKIVSNILDMSRGAFGSDLPPDSIFVHQETQMIIFHGTQDQMENVQQVLSALKQRSDSIRTKSQLPAAKSSDNLIESTPAAAK